MINNRAINLNSLLISNRFSIFLDLKYLLKRINRYSVFQVLGGTSENVIH